MEAAGDRRDSARARLRDGWDENNQGAAGVLPVDVVKAAELVREYSIWLEVGLGRI